MAGTRHVTSEETVFPTGSRARWGTALLVLLFGSLIFAAANRIGFREEGFVLLPTMVFLSVAAIVDLRRNTIQDWLTLPGLGWALTASLYQGTSRAVEAFFGALACGGALLLLATISRGGIGGGDVKLAALVGASLGWRWGLVALALAHIAAGLLAATLVLTRRRSWKNALPMGPFLAVFALLAHLARPL